jgi:peptide/histidine transporter 3/4
MVLAVISMFYAAGVEWHRLRMYRQLHPGDTQDTYPPESVPLTILWQAPAYILVAASEVYASIGQLEFFYDQVGGGWAARAELMNVSSAGMGLREGLCDVM